LEDVIPLLFRLVAEENKDPLCVFDACGSEVLEIGDLAQKVKDTLGKYHLAIHRAHSTAERSETYHGNPSFIHHLFQKFHILPQSLETQILRTCLGRL
jgi:hypothetical protein